MKIKWFLFFIFIQSYLFTMTLHMCTAYRITCVVPLSHRHSLHRSAPVCCGTSERTRLAVRLLPSLLDLSCRPCPHLSQISLSIFLFIVMWFPRLYMHYCSQWLFLQAQHIPVNRWDMRDQTHRTIIRKHTVSSSSLFQTHKYMQKYSRREYADLYKCLLTIIHWKHTRTPKKFMQVIHALLSYVVHVHLYACKQTQTRASFTRLV